MADLTIKVEGSLKQDTQNMGKTLEDIRNRGGSKAITDNQYYKAKDDLKLIDKLASKTEITADELTILNQAFKRVSEVVKTAANKISNLTKEAQELADKLEQAKKAENENEATKDKYAKQKRDSSKTYAATMKGRSLQYTDDKGRVHKGKSFDFLNNNELLTDKKGILKNSVSILDANGKVIKDDTEIRKQINKALEDYRTAIRELAAADSKSAELAKQKNDAQLAFDTKVQQDKDLGLTHDADLIQAAESTTSKVHDDIAGMKTDLRTQKEAESAKEVNTSLSQLGPTAERTSGSLGKVAKQLSIWAIGLRLVRKAINEVKATIIDLDKSLTEQAMVTGKTRKEVYNLLGSYQDLAIQLGSTTKEVSAAVTEFIRQGKSTQEAMTLAEAAISAAKVAAINTSDSINYLTTALNGFRLSANQAMEVSDKFAAVSANAATSYEEIAIALSKVASQANLAGMSIDYTTALLAKGLETTREAPETIGTALKTVIARMREITDYGETLEDGLDLNNVESQLAYVGIALRNASGELRSTEDVLNDLGKKWDSLNANQQAAIAKALAGTRQQSRLIAMMSDYERVIELQEISSRSAGATMAQIGVYSQGLEAALNRLSTSWEKIVSTITNSDVIVFFVDFVTAILDGINNILDSTWGMVAASAILVSWGIVLLKNKIRERNMNVLILKEQTKEKIEKLKAVKASKEALVIELKQVKLAEKKAKLEEIKGKIEAVKQRIAAGDTTAQSELLALSMERQSVEQDISAIEAEIRSTDSDINTITGEINSSTKTLNNLSSGLVSNIMQMIPGASLVLTIFTSLAGVMRLIGAISKKNHKQEMKQDKERTPGIYSKIFGAGSEGGIPGLAIAAGIVAALAILTGIGFAIAGAFGAFKSEDEKTADNVKELSNAIYTLSKRSEAINTAIDTVDHLDKKLIKSKEDAEALSSALEQVGDKLSGEEKENLISGLGMSEQDFYSRLSDNEKIDFLKEYEKEVDRELAKNEASLIKTLKNANWNSAKNGEMYKLQARSSVKRTAYQALDELDLTSEEASSRQSIIEKIIESADDSKLKSMLGDLKGMRNLLTELSNIKVEDGSVASDILQDDDASLKARTEAFKKLREELSSTSSIWKALSDAYSEFKVFAEWDSEVLDLIENLKITNDEINNLYTGYSKILNILKEEGTTTDLSTIMSEEEYQDRLINYLLPALSRTNMNVAAAMQEAFGDFLAKVNAEDYEEVYSTILNQVANAVQVGVQNIGQNVDKLKSSVTSIYTAAQKWNTMSGTEQSTFLSENQEMFSGEEGKILLEAFQTQDYQQIQRALASNPTLRQNINNEIKEVAAELAFEEAKIGADRNEALIKYLKEKLQQLQSNDFLSVDLETLVEQENKRIEAYKELLQKEQDALTESLEARKEAYQKYFDAINQAEEDQNYEENAELLITNLSKLAGSTNADSLAKTEELENSLAELEKERLQTLRERAQEAVIQSIDDTISSIDEKFDELLLTNRGILNMLNGTSGNELVASLLSTESFAGKTANEAQLYLNEIQSTFGSQVSNIDWNNMKVTNTGGNLTLNIGDKVIQLTGQEAQGRNIYDAILAALVQNGISA